MKLSRLLNIGLVVTAFMFNPWASWDVREIKTHLAVVFALAIFGLKIYTDGLKPINNKWLLILLAYLPITLIFSAQEPTSLLGINTTGFWFWKPFCYFVSMLLLGTSIASHDFSEKEISGLFKVLSWCGFLTACYVIIQYFKCDQFFKSDFPDTGPYGGFIGNPTLTAHYIAMTVPFMVFVKKWWMIPFVIASLFITDSLMAWGGLLGGLAYMISSFGRLQAICVAVMCVIGVSFLVLNFPHGREHERFDRWKQVVKDIKKPNFITGRGIGSFQFFFRAQNPGYGDKPNRFEQAHNDYLEWFYGTGLIGFGLMILAFFKGLKDFFIPGIHQFRTICVLSSLITMLLISAGCFDFQVGSTMFLTTVLIGLLMNRGFICRS